MDAKTFQFVCLLDGLGGYPTTSITYRARGRSGWRRIFYFQVERNARCFPSVLPLGVRRLGVLVLELSQVLASGIWAGWMCVSPSRTTLDHTVLPACQVGEMRRQVYLYLKNDLNYSTVKVSIRPAFPLSPFLCSFFLSPPRPPVTVRWYSTGISKVKFDVVLRVDTDTSSCGSR